MITMQNPQKPVYNWGLYELGSSSHADSQELFFTHKTTITDMHVPCIFLNLAHRRGLTPAGN